MARAFLIKHQCNPEIYDYVSELKPGLPVEVSIKRYLSGEIKMGRWTLFIGLSTWTTFSTAQQRLIFSMLGFSNPDLFDLPLKQADRETDIILGQDGATGKVYFDYLDRPVDPHLICYESTGRIKYYRMKKTESNWRNWLYVYNEQGEHIGIHVRINGENGVYWYGIGPDSATTYLRP